MIDQFCSLYNGFSLLALPGELEASNVIDQHWVELFCRSIGLPELNCDHENTKAQPQSADLPHPLSPKWLRVAVSSSIYFMLLMRQCYVVM